MQRKSKLASSEAREKVATHDSNDLCVSASVVTWYLSKKTEKLLLRNKEKLQIYLNGKFAVFFNSHYLTSDLKKNLLIMQVHSYDLLV